MMKKSTFRFSDSSTDFYFDASFSNINQLVNKEHSVIITDQNVFDSHKNKFKSWNSIILKPGEKYKVQKTADTIIDQLVGMQADRTTWLVGVGGGVVTDITGYVASIYMRGLSFGFIPTSLLGMVDAAIGGKNGIDVGVYKNLVGSIRQPEFLLYDINFLKTLPEAEWINGFAEIIKHSCIKDADMFSLLERNNINNIRKNKSLLSGLIKQNARLKANVVMSDEFEKGERKLLNFGHTLGHALENQYKLAHGQAIAIGMANACVISEQITGFKQTDKVIAMLEKYKLPTFTEFDKKKVFNILTMDKKRHRKEINYILLEKIGRAVIKSLPLNKLQKIIGEL